ncbi:MAG: hypothetical protein HQK89_17475 [Nitrospirae bacterium]|nr:hypothetical protein [Nitrospirota bacterium]
MKKIVIFCIFMNIWVFGVMACEEANYDFTSTILHIPIVVVDSKIYYKVDLKLNGDSFSLSGATQAQSLVNGCQSSFDSKTLTLNIPFIPVSGKYYSVIMKSAADYGFPLQNITPAALSAMRTVTIGKDTGKTLRQLTGVNAGPYPSGDLTNPPLDAQYKQIGVTMVRTHGFEGPFDMHEIYHDHTKDPNNAQSFNFTDSDVRYRSIANNGHELYLRVGDGNNPYPPEPENLDNYVTAMVNVVGHYKSGKWNGYTGNIRYVEIWNEPDGAFWPGYTMDYFTEFYIKAAKAIKAAFPDLKVGGPGFGPGATLTDSKKMVVEQFVSRLASSGATLDFLSWHMYTNTPNKYTPAASYYRTILNKYGYTSTESHISEWNTDVNGDDTPENVDLRVNAKGAAINTAAWIALQLTDVSVSTFFRGTDSSMILTSFYGLFKADGTPKKVALAFSLWSKMVNSREVLSTTGGDSDFTVLAGKSTDGKIMLLIANTASTAVTYSLNFDKSTGLSTSNYSMEVSEVSDASDAVQTRSGNAGLITMGGYSVNLVTLTPLK